ncbi:sulfatase-like hydrolase/transferase [Gayadomonas joobiniege]|uniref:sulfatase-like hydrolase/transferase n=1 Tax=Gayadomonas joobiniege TaxID=1234606 RepID=UPI00036E31B9|nr:sulfatase-like hydrolase/transferase [Gayadomonas joobiniege]
MKIIKLASTIAASLFMLACSQSTSNNYSESNANQTLPELNEVKQKPNILWIITDDQRADSIAAFNLSQTGSKNSPLGYVESPNIDALAAEGTMFTHAYNQSPGCAPSRSSMITGLYPHKSGRYGFERTHDQTDLFTPPVPVELRKQGYQTALFGKSGVRIYEYKNGTTWNDLGFYDQWVDFKKDLAHNNLTDWVKIEHYDKNWKNLGKSERFVFPNGRVEEYRVDRDFNPANKPLEQELEILRAHTRASNTLIIGGQSPQPAGETLDGHIVKSFKNFLNNPDRPYRTQFNKTYQGVKTNQPLMTSLNFHFPHTPVLPPKSFRDRFKNKGYQVPEFSKAEVEKLPPQLQRLYKVMKIDGLSAAEKQQAIADYYAFCAYGDHLIGEAVNAFKEYSRQNNQEYIIMMTVGDHGWQLGEQGIEAKFGPYNTSNQGIIIAVDSQQKRFPAGKVVNDFVEYVDLAPSILAAAGMDVAKEAPHLSGFDLAKVIRSKQYHRDYVLAEVNFVMGPRAYLRSETFAFSMRTRPTNGQPGKSFAPGDRVKWALNASDKAVEMALFDLRCDPAERNNLAYHPAYQEVASTLRDKLARIVLGDGRVEVDWEKPNSYHISNFAKGAHDRKLTALKNLQLPNCQAANF